MEFGERQRLYWHRSLPRRDPGNPAVEGFARPKVDLLRRWLPTDREHLILEVGAGSGYLTHYLGALGRVVATDFSPTMLCDNPCSRRAVAEGACLPFADRTFDLVIEANLLHHVNRPDRVLLEMRRVSRRLLALIEPNRWNPLMLALALAKSEERRTLAMCRSYLSRLMRDARLELLEVAANGFVTPNRMPVAVASVLRRLERPSRLAAYIVAVGRRTD